MILFVYNGRGYAACRINITNFSTCKDIKLFNIKFVITTNCGMRYSLCCVSVARGEQPTDKEILEA